MKQGYALLILVALTGCSFLPNRVGTYKYVVTVPANQKNKSAFSIPLNMGMTLNPDGTFVAFNGRDQWTGGYSINGDKIAFTGSYSRQAPRGHFEGNTLVIHDRTQLGGITLEKQ